MELLVGTSGYSFKEWKGSFYPEKIASDEMLSFYAEKLPAVEINNTFYRLPRKSVLETWAGQVPEGFRFALKASRRITHMKRLKNAEDETRYLLETTETLGDRLGVILFQLPPNLRKDHARLKAFLDILPASTRAAFEFRQETWFDDEVYDSLRSHNRALCLADDDDREEPALTRTADWGYLRLRRSTYSDDKLRSWAERIRSQGWNQAFVFFKHEEGGTGPSVAARFIDVARKIGKS
jgi:uncharacterized protein YecE (DUF72 family)